MESQHSFSDNAEDHERQASFRGDLVFTILTALPQGEWEQRVNERELRYLQLLEQRIKILECNAEASGKRQISRRPRRSRLRSTSPRPVGQVRRTGRNY